MMRILSEIIPNRIDNRKVLTKSERFCVFYHDFFDYALTFADLIKWNASEVFSSKPYEISVARQNGYYFLQGREGLVYKRVLRERISAKKMEIAKKAAETLGLIPGVEMVAVTGSLAMGNSGDEGDIDLMIITKKGTLWTTRLLSYFVLSTLHYVLRRPFDRNQKDKLCLNMWMDEADLVWNNTDRNVYTAHEIAQIVPLVNKNRSYEKFLYKNKWILKFWPNSVRISNPESGIRSKNSIFMPLEKICYWLQYKHMRSKITREVVTPTRGIFHPQDLGRLIISRLTLDKA